MIKRLTFLAFALLLAACGPKTGKTTKVVGRFKKDAPALVEITRGNDLDTAILVTDGRFEAEIPTDLTRMTILLAGDTQISFLADGATVTIHPEAGTAVSSLRNGPQARYAEYDAWMTDFFAGYHSRLAEFGEDKDAADAYLEDVVGPFDEYQKAAVRANPDSFVALMAIAHITNAEPEEILALLNGLSDEMKATPQAMDMTAACEGRCKTSEGVRFTDFEAVQDPANPETSVARLSDYVGKGKYVLVDFWASWCTPCLEEMPYLKEVYDLYRGEDFDMLSVAVSDRIEDSKAAAPEFGIVWNQIVGAGQVPLRVYGIDSIPYIILFAPDGTVLKRGLREDKIGEAVKEVLGR